MRALYTKESLVKNFGDDKSQFQNLQKNSEVYEELRTSSDRDAVFIGAAALEVLLERLLLNFIIDDPSAINLIVRQLDKLGTRIQLCFALGLISEDEKHDLKLLQEVRNAFAHNLLGCNFKNPEVVKYISNFVIAKKANSRPDVVGIRAFFHIEILTLDNILSHRLNQLVQRVKCANMKVNGS
jgi:DNA-binding MltR family transcriptional regulator